MKRKNAKEKKEEEEDSEEKEGEIGGNREIEILGEDLKEDSLKKKKKGKTERAFSSFIR